MPRPIVSDVHISLFRDKNTEIKVRGLDSRLVAICFESADRDRDVCSRSKIDIIMSDEQFNALRLLINSFAWEGK